MQLVGTNCGLCGERINSALDAELCPTCGRPVHSKCLTNTGTLVEEQTPDSVCNLCGMSTAQATTYSPPAIARDFSAPVKSPAQPLKGANDFVPRHNKPNRGWFWAFMILVVIPVSVGMRSITENSVENRVRKEFSGAPTAAVTTVAASFEDIRSLGKSLSSQPNSCCVWIYKYLVDGRTYTGRTVFPASRGYVAAPAYDLTVSYLPEDPQKHILGRVRDESSGADRADIALVGFGAFCGLFLAGMYRLTRPAC